MVDGVGKKYAHDDPGVHDDAVRAASLLGSFSTDLEVHGELGNMFTHVLQGSMLRKHPHHLAVAYFVGHGWSHQSAGTPWTMPRSPMPREMVEKWKATMPCPDVDVMRTGGEWCLASANGTPCPFGVGHFCGALQWTLASAGEDRTPCHVVVVCDNCHAAGWIDGLAAAFAAIGLDEMNVTVSVQAACRTTETNPGQLFCPTWVKLNSTSAEEVAALIAAFRAGPQKEDTVIHPVWSSHGHAPAKPDDGSPIITVGGVHYFVDPAFFAFAAAKFGVSTKGADERVHRRRLAQEARVAWFQVRVHVCCAVVPCLRLSAHSLTRCSVLCLPCRARWLMLVLMLMLVLVLVLVLVRILCLPSCCNSVFRWGAWVR